MSEVAYTTVPQNKEFPHLLLGDVVTLSSENEMHEHLPLFNLDMSWIVELINNQRRTSFGSIFRLIAAWSRLEHPSPVVIPEFSLSP
ncbi:hypothetical protein GN244_ATG09269 [Phytophthora infestans]|uniref:Uncharacterized protein n=1 Tax=Phytophthora infestans TaxID=4787 RepID=A0A833S292_PHYIN|nr:hypothetical protein GN244_ATG09269 [Phytophthora infestans]